MPRAKPYERWKAGGLVPTFRPPQTPETRGALQALLRAVGLTPNTAASKALLRNVREAIEAYHGLEPILDHAPRPANQRAALRRIDDGEPHSRAPLPLLKRALDELDSPTREALQQVPPAGFDMRRLQQLLDDLDRAITIVDRQLETHESRGAEPKEARRLVLSLLAHAFQTAYVLDHEEYGDQLREFLETACRLGGISLPRSDRVLDLVPTSLKVPRKTP